MSENSQQAAVTQPKPTNEYSEMSLQKCRQSIALDSHLNISDLTLIFNEERIGDARYYAWKFDRDAACVLLGKTLAVGGTILGVSVAPDASVLGAAFAAIAGVGLYIHGVRERRLALSHLNQDLAKVKVATPQ